MGKSRVSRVITYKRCAVDKVRMSIYSSTFFAKEDFARGAYLPYMQTFSLLLSSLEESKFLISHLLTSDIVSPISSRSGQKQPDNVCEIFQVKAGLGKYFREKIILHFKVIVHPDDTFTSNS